MAIYNPTIGLPGIGSDQTATPRRILQQKDGEIYLANSAILDGSESRDSGNTGDLDKLRAGTFMGIITASGLWAPCFVGVLASAYTSGGTSLTVSAAQAVELDRLVGGSGTAELLAIGAPTAAGTVVATAFDHSAINVTTGVLTVTSLGVNKHADTLIAVNDGRQVPRGFIRDGYPVKVTDSSGVSVDQLLPGLLVGGFVDYGQQLPALAVPTTNTSLVAYIKVQLRLNGTWLFSDDFGV